MPGGGVGPRPWIMGTLTLCRGGEWWALDHG